jgi:hypothetical protein
MDERTCNENSAAMHIHVRDAEGEEQIAGSNETHSYCKKKDKVR